jgi:DEAD/DEAH box helicase
MEVSALPPDAVTGALEFAGRVAPTGLTAKQARLYSHVTRLRAGQRGVRWTEADTEEALADAVKLIESGRIARTAGQQNWMHPIRRAAEILEWLSVLEGLEDIPVVLLSAAAYQVAGYPAQALGLLSRAEGTASDSSLLRNLLQGDFPALEEGLRAVWAVPAREQREQTATAGAGVIADRMLDEVLRAFGVFCAFMRWGQDRRLETALGRMDELAALMARTASSSTWLLARLTAEVMAGYAGAALRVHTEPLLEGVDAEGRVAFERYLRRAYLKGRSLAWPSQVRGIHAMQQGASFALCTPTGSGKTTIAELGILQSLFAADEELDPDNAPLVLYVTPTKALAAEVEAKLAAVVQGLSSRTLQVTGLYGGTDWGPSDAWLTTENPTVLICTQEKAEALVRFLGPLFVHRIRLVVVDEAHQVQWPAQQNRFADARALRLESLLSRLLTYGRADRRVIALSAVAGGIENTLAKWLTGNRAAEATIEPYRSTRQLVGKLICESGGGFRIEYDLLNSRRLRITGRDDQPHVPNPFPRVPDWRPDWAKPETALREPTLWAALQSVAAGGDRRQAVLVFVPERAPHLAKTFVDLLEGVWSNRSLPYVFQPPVAAPEANLWARCKAACADFFGIQSYEYRLLQHGIVLHHGKMPPSLGRLLVEVIERQIASIVLATSTLSEGVNLPFETVIFAAPTRSGKTLDVRSVANTIGRAGRPGHGTEGRALFVLPEGRIPVRWRAYQELITALESQAEAAQAPQSPLALVLLTIRRHWWRLYPQGSEERFLAWLEVTAPSEAGGEEARDALDALDQMLIAIAAEEEQFGALDGVNLEERLKQVWGWSYARHAAREEERLRGYFVQRGLAIRRSLYPEASERKRMYITSLPPRDARVFLTAYSEIRSRLESGFDYADWDGVARADYLERILEALWQVPAFAPAEAPGGKKGSWQATLRWWLRAPGAPRPSNPVDISRWFEHVSTSYLYKAAWGIGNTIGLATFDLHKGALRAPTLEEWPETGLPWVTLWIKELLNWGTLDPAAAALLAARRASTRAEAEAMAASYYQTVSGLSANDRLRPSRIKEWVDSLTESARQERPAEPIPFIPAVPIPRFPEDGPSEWRVWPVVTPESVRWYDVAGYVLAESSADVTVRALDWDYWFRPREGRVRSATYLQG